MMLVDFPFYVQKQYQLQQVSLVRVTKLFFQIAKLLLYMWM